MRSRGTALFAKVVSQSAERNRRECPLPSIEERDFVNPEPGQMWDHRSGQVFLADIPVSVTSFAEEGATNDSLFISREDMKGVRFAISIEDPPTFEFVKSGILKCGGFIDNENPDFIVSDSEKSHENFLNIDQLRFAFQAAGIHRKPLNIKVAICDARTGEKLKKASIEMPEIVLCDSSVLNGSPFRRPKCQRTAGNTFETDGARKNARDAPESGYCQICGERYTDKDEHRASPTHVENQAKPGLWDEFDAFAREMAA